MTFIYLETIIRLEFNAIDSKKKSKSVEGTSGNFLPEGYEPLWIP